VTIKEGFGFIRCVDREGRVFFHFNELLRVDVDVKPQDEVEFTILQVRYIYKLYIIIYIYIYISDATV